GRPLDDRVGRERPGRSPGSRIVLLPAPSQPGDGQWLSRVSSPITVTGSRRACTAFPGVRSRGRPGANSGHTLANAPRVDKRVARPEPLAAGQKPRARMQASKASWKGGSTGAGSLATCSEARLAPTPPEGSGRSTGLGASGGGSGAGVAVTGPVQGPTCERRVGNGVAGPVPGQGRG